jgi:hypothetical protein
MSNPSENTGESAALMQRLRTSTTELMGLVQELQDYGSLVKTLVGEEEFEDIEKTLLRNIDEEIIGEAEERQYEVPNDGIPLPSPENIKRETSLFEKQIAILRLNFNSVPTIEEIKQRKFKTAKSVGEIGLKKNLSPDLTRHLATFAVGEPTTLNTGDVQSQREGVSLAPRAVPPLNRTTHNQGGKHRRKTRKHKTRKHKSRRKH